MGKQVNELLTGLAYSHALVLIKKFEYEVVITRINGCELVSPDKCGGEHCIKIRLHDADEKAIKYVNNKVEIVNFELLESAIVEIDNGNSCNNIKNQFYDPDMKSDSSSDNNSNSSDNSSDNGSVDSN